ncbi:MAG: universal stress protein [Bacteroidales bacterium]|nr:universal stress protein [Bacteroidales bacterium]MCF8327484.1 universal stress protein [Bacteroidales bacterium]
MKRVIIVGMDFSEGSEVALNYAIRLANKLYANILMVWVEKEKASSSVYKSEEHDPQEEASKRFEDLIQKKKDSLTGGKFMYKIRSGKVHKEIASQAKYHEAFLVVVGTHGISGFEEFWIGSSAYRIVTSSPCPVITIRYEEAEDRPIKKIVLPVDSTRQTRQKSPFVATLAKLFEAEVVVLGVYTTMGTAVKMLVNGYVDQTAKYMEENNVKYSVDSREAGNITDTTIEYAREVNADMIAIMTEQETTTANLLLGPYAQQMVNHSPIPVLSVRPKNIYDWLVKT